MTRRVLERFEMGKTMNSQKYSREKLKTFKNWLICAKHTIFVTESSVFRDWKFYPQESRKVSRENLWALSRLDLPPANKLPYWVARNIKNPNFEKYYKYFSRLGHWPVSESRKIYVWAHDWNMWLDQPATESPKEGNTVFEIFDIFVKTKVFPKTTKTLKNIFVFDQ